MHHNAEIDESAFRLSLAHVMRDLGDRMLNYTETGGPGLDPRKTEIIDILVDGIGECLKVMNRRGKIRILGGDDNGIPDLEIVDNQLIMLLEHITGSTDSMVGDDSSLFSINAHDLTMLLDDFLELIEERNRLLGLGWESEIRRGFYLGLEREPS